MLDANGQFHFWIFEGPVCLSKRKIVENDEVFQPNWTNGLRDLKLVRELDRHQAKESKFKLLSRGETKRSELFAD